MKKQLMKRRQGELLRRFTPRRFQVSWIAADPSRPQAFRLVPIVVLCESEDDDRQEGKTICLLEFYPRKPVKDPTWSADLPVLYFQSPVELHTAKANRPRPHSAG